MAYVIRPFVTSWETKPFFIPSLLVKYVGAIALGLIYQFYYDGGDTFNYHTHGSRWIWKAMMNNPIAGIDLFSSEGDHIGSTFEYSSQIVFFTDPAAYFIVKIAAFFDLFTFGTYSSTALLFATFSFSGLWAMFYSFQKLYPALAKQLAIAIFFVPSVFLWGSGVLKDSITLGVLGWSVFFTHCLFFFDKNKFSYTALLLLSFYLLFKIKIYILLCFLPSVIILVFASKLHSIKSIPIKLLISPLAIVIAISLAYFSILKVGEDNPKYALENLAETARITAHDIAFWTGRNAGSTYNLGELDGTIGGTLALLPNAISASLFRPFPWEASSFLMLFSAIESTCVLALTIFVAVRANIFKTILKTTDTHILFCLVFSLSFAFAVGVSTFNFGTLSRYKIPLVPFYLIAMTLIVNRDENSQNDTIKKNIH